MSNATEGTRLRTLATLVMACILSLFLLACGGASTAEPADQGPAGEAEQSNRSAARPLSDPANAKETHAPGDAPGN